MDNKREILNNIFGEEFSKKITDKMLETFSFEQVSEFANDSMNNHINPLIEELLIKGEETLLPMAISRPSLLIRGKLFDKEIDFILDTGAQNCVIDYKLVKSLGFEEYIDKRQKTLVVGIGQNLSHGIIPYAELEIEGSLYPIMFTVIDMPQGASTHPLIGLNFMMFYNTKLDFEKRKLHIMGSEKNLIIKEGS